MFFNSLLDEIQSGFGRTGCMFAFEHAGIRPDGLAVGKALGGGLLPVSAFLGRAAVMDLFEPGSHGSTFGGNALAAAVGLEALNVIEDEQLVERSAELGSYLLERLAALRSPIVRNVRGKGLWAAVEFDEARVTGRDVCQRLAEHGVLTKETHGSVVRLAPPLVIGRPEIDIAMQALRATIADLGDD